MQKWFSDAFAGASPYRLFALSNVGSLLALLELSVLLRGPLGFAAAGGDVVAGLRGVRRVLRVLCLVDVPGPRNRTPRCLGPLAGEHAPTEASSRRAGGCGRWIGLPALASVMFLAVTNEVCQNVATVPLLWIIPLSFYLLSFIVAFDHPRWYIRPVVRRRRDRAARCTSPNFGDFAGRLAKA